MEGKQIEVVKIIDGLYNLHLKTAATFRGAAFRAKFYSREKLIVWTGSLLAALKWTNFNLFDKQIKTEEELFFDFEPSSHEDLITSRDATQRISIFGADFRISPRVILLFSSLVLLGFISSAAK